MERLSGHNYLLSRENVFQEKFKWFTSRGAEIVNALRFATGENTPDIRIARLLLARELSVVSSPAHFEDEYGGDDPAPTEEDRQAMLAHLKFMTSFTGILHAKEIEQIIEGPFGSFLDFIPQQDVVLPSQLELKEKILEWKSEGWEIVGFQGSFDPPTETHLLNATDAMLLADEEEIKIKIIFILDGDELIQRKASPEEERPRFDVTERRQILEPFWQVAGTYVSNVTSAENSWDYVREYHELGLDYLLMTRRSNPTREEIFETERRMISIRGAGKKVLWLEELPKGITSTEIMQFHGF